MFQPIVVDVLYMVTVSVPLPVTLKVPVPSVVMDKVSYREDETSLTMTIPDPPEPPACFIVFTDDAVLWAPPPPPVCRCALSAFIWDSEPPEDPPPADATPDGHV